MNEENPAPELKPIQQLETMYREHWEHSRHCEKEMFWFTNIYIVAVAAILAFIRDTNDNLAFVLISFGLILSVFGLFIVIALTQGHHIYITNIVTICYRWNVMEFYADHKKAFYLKRVHRWFFEVTVVLFAALFLHYLSQVWTLPLAFREYWIWITAVSAIIIWAATKVMYRYEWDKHTRDWRDYRKVLRNDNKGEYRNEWDTWFKKPEFWKEIARNPKEEKKEKQT